MEETKTVNQRPVFQNQPILCPWVTCQPYPSTQVIKNKLHEFAKNNGPTLNNSSSKNSSLSDAATYNPYNPSSGQQSSSTHFFYFLRLMQLFPDTHPATLHTVLTLSKNNFFYAIDKLLYAKKVKSSFSKRQTYPFKTTRGRGGYTSCSTRGKPYSRPIRSYQPITRISDDLAEVQRIIGLTEKPYIEVQSISAEDNAEEINEDRNNIANGTHQVMNICIENSHQIVQDGQTYVDAENQEVIEIVCFDNEQQMVEQPKLDDSMELEAYAENGTEHDVRIEQEPAVIVVDTINDLDESELGEEGHLIESHESNQLNSADFANNSPLVEETRENDK